LQRTRRVIRKPRHPFFITLEMAARIVLVRHGPSAHVEKSAALNRAGVQVWRAAYDSAGIHPSAEPPEALRRLAAEATHLIASDLPRARDSAERLAPHRQIIISDLLRESALAIPNWPTRLPLAAWGMLIHLRWAYEIVRGSDVAASDRARAAAAADWLTDVAAHNVTVLVVTHGVFRRVLGNQLVGRGWVRTRRQKGYRHWSAWSFSAR
jgi:broad specificity phosphatase PhoE